MYKKINVFYLPHNFKTNFFLYKNNYINKLRNKNNFINKFKLLTIIFTKKKIQNKRAIIQLYKQEKLKKTMKKAIKRAIKRRGKAKKKPTNQHKRKKLRTLVLTTRKLTTYSKEKAFPFYSKMSRL